MAFERHRDCHKAHAFSSVREMERTNRILPSHCDQGCTGYQQGHQEPGGKRVVQREVGGVSGVFNLTTALFSQSAVKLDCVPAALRGCLCECVRQRLR